MDVKELNVRLTYLQQNNPSNNYIELVKDLIQKREQMTNDEILKYAHHMHFVMRGTEKKVSLDSFFSDYPLYFVDNIHVAKRSCSFSAEPFVEAQGLEKIGSITTYHTFGGFYGFVCPSIDEAIFQCPKEWLDIATAFEFSYHKTEDVRDVYDSVLDLHVLKTTYYKGDLPEVVKRKKMFW